MYIGVDAWNVLSRFGAVVVGTAQQTGPDLGAVLKDKNTLYSTIYVEKTRADFKTHGISVAQSIAGLHIFRRHCQRQMRYSNAR